MKWLIILLCVYAAAARADGIPPSDFQTSGPGYMSSVLEFENDFDYICDNPCCLERLVCLGGDACMTKFEPLLVRCISPAGGWEAFGSDFYCEADLPSFVKITDAIVMCTPIYVDGEYLLLEEQCLVRYWLEFVEHKFKTQNAPLRKPDLVSKLAGTIETASAVVVGYEREFELELEKAGPATNPWPQVLANMADP